jgi:tRNA-dihydrouridine synthase
MHGADMMYSEFISSEGLIRDAIKSRMKLDIFDYERPVGIQIFWVMKRQWPCLLKSFLL